MRRAWFAIGLLSLALLVTLHARDASAQSTNCQRFAETGISVCGGFLQYWQTHGALAQLGLPISSEMAEQSEADGKTYTVQYFERSVFEQHPENQPPYDVLLSLLGSARYNRLYPSGAPGQHADSSPGSISFPQTGKHLGGRFLAYWQQHGGLMQQGYPISEPFDETSDLDGKQYTVQYFERSVFEYHPENGAANDVLLSQLGTFALRSKYPNGVPGAINMPTATPTPDFHPTLEQRPLQLPSVSQGGKCPVSQDHKGVLPGQLADLSVYGQGPMYLPTTDTRPSSRGFVTPGGTLRASTRDNGYYGIKAPWTSRPEYDGPFLVRGRQLDGAGALRFEYGGSPAVRDQMWLDQANDIGSTGAMSGWGFWPSGLLFTNGGCYGLQIDSLGGADVLVFQVVTP